jgi:predicted patatin/cPLA2 family phospholipase
MRGRTHQLAEVARPLLPAVCFLLLATACSLVRGPTRPVPLPPGVEPGDLIDRVNPVESKSPLDPDALARVGKQLQERRQKERADKERRGENVEEKRYNFLVISGGGTYGAYSAGVLVGWSQLGRPPEKGGRPRFDVVTGISTGALIAPFAFLGPEYDCALKDEYTTVSNDDIFVRRRSIRALLSESVVDTTPFRHRIERVVTYDMMAKVAAEHEKGRRLYVGSTNLDTKRLVVWDLGAIAKRGTPEARELIINVIMASAAIPGFFPAVHFKVNIDGANYDELHVDGGVTRSLFFRPPYIEPSKREAFGPDSLADSNVYVLVAGKIYPDPQGVRPRTLPVAGAAISDLLYSLTRADLFHLYTYAILTGMNYRVSAIPPEMPIAKSATDFNPVEMGRLFNAGWVLGKEGAFKMITVTNPKTGKREPAPTLAGTAWRDTPPGLEPGEELRARTSLLLKVQREQGARSRQPQPTTGGPAAGNYEAIPIPPRPVEK